MIELQNQHWVPQFLLRNFADTDGKVFRLNVADDVVTKPPPKYAASSSNFNELMVAGHPRSFEDRFEKIETAAAPVIAKIVETHTLYCIDEKQRNSVAKFIAVQAFRTEAYRQGLAAGRQAHDVGMVLDLQMSDLQALASLIGRRRWVLMVTGKETPFYLGDNPVVLQSTEHPEKAGEVGLDMAGVEAFMPLSPDCALYIPCPGIGNEIVSGFRSALRITAANLAGIELPDFDVAEALPIARRTLTSAGPLYRSLTCGDPYVADNGNVENLNYLQCAWASSGVYSNRADFSFAKRVFRENPQYRKVLPTSIVKTALAPVF